MYIIYLEARISNNFSPIIRINIHLRTYNEQLRVTFTIILFFFFFYAKDKIFTITHRAVSLFSLFPANPVFFSRIIFIYFRPVLSWIFRLI